MGVTAWKQPIETKNTRRKEISLLAKSDWMKRPGDRRGFELHRGKSNFSRCADHISPAAHHWGIALQQWWPYVAWERTKEGAFQRSLYIGKARELLAETGRKPSPSLHSSVLWVLLNTITGAVRRCTTDVGNGTSVITMQDTTGNARIFILIQP
jgi:hypothetical protein